VYSPSFVQHIHNDDDDNDDTNDHDDDDDTNDHDDDDDTNDHDDDDDDDDYNYSRFSIALNMCSSKIIITIIITFIINIHTQTTQRKVH
jgi:ABC-type Zn2+ transport system substrate-binding protein/surface adhesin